MTEDKQRVVRKHAMSTPFDGESFVEQFQTITKMASVYTVIYYRKTSSISRTKSQNLNVSCILLQLSSLNPLKPGVKLRMKM